MSVNRASEVWKEIKPFALRDLKAIQDAKNVNSSVNSGYFIILYDVSTQKLKYYSASLVGLQAALAAAGTGDIVYLPPETIELSDVLLPLKISSTRVDVVAMVVTTSPPANWNTPNYDDNAWSSPDLGHDVTPVGDSETLWLGATQQRVLFRQPFTLDAVAISSAILSWDGDDKTNGLYVNGELVDSWPTAVSGDDHPVRTVDVTSQLNLGAQNVIAMDQTDVIVGGNAGVTWELVINYAQTTIPVGVEVAGMGENCILQGGIENNGILTNVLVTGQILGSGSYHVYDTDSAWKTNKQIISKVATGEAPFEIESSTLNTNLNADLLDGEHGSAFVKQLNKTNATAAPAVTDDSGDGYTVGSVWIDVTNDEAYICVDATEGAAVWINLSASTPTAHAATHQSGGGDAIKLDDLTAPDDNTDLDVSTVSHGLTPKLPNDATLYLNGLGGYSTPAGGEGGSTTGWNSDANTWTYDSADAPTFVASVNADMTAVLSTGMRIKLTQTTVKYFIVTAVGAFSGGASLITLYGGTDYTLANAAITNPAFSTCRAPLGFPLDPAKWTVEVTDTNNLSQANPTQNTWYNLGSLSITIPIGIWNLIYFVTLRLTDSLTGSYAVFSTLSVANNSESDVSMTAGLFCAGASSIFSGLNRSRFLSLASKTVYYLNERTNSLNLDSISVRGDYGLTVIRAVSAYL